jgi:hypothetical protein
MRVTSILFAIACGASCAVACGGSKTSSGNNGNGDDAATGNSSGSASSSGSGSSSSSGGTGDDAATGGDAGLSCTDSSSCPGQLCCATVGFGGTSGFMITVTAACAASCTGMEFQLCSSDTECTTAGDTCTPSPLMMGSYCAPEGGIGGFTRPDGGFTRPDGGFTRPDGGDVPEGGGPSDGAVE